MRILSALECHNDTELSISIVGDKSIRIINRDYLSKDRPTNVISFSLQEGDYAGINPNTLGDVIISADTALREAQEGDMTHFERISFLLLHGILHLCGFDHERSGEQEAQRMEQKEIEIYKILTDEGLLTEQP